MPYCRSGVDESLPGVIYVGGKQYCISGDFRYNQRPFLKVPYQGSNLGAPHRAINGAIWRGKVTVEWYLMEVKLYWSTMDYKRKMRARSRLWGLYISPRCCL